MSFGGAAGLLGMNPLSPAVLVLSGHVTRAGVPRLCAELEAILAASRADVVDCDVGGITEPDLASVEAVARLSVVARRAAWQTVAAAPCAAGAPEPAGPRGPGRRGGTGRRGGSGGGPGGRFLTRRGRCGASGTLVHRAVADHLDETGLPVRPHRRTIRRMGRRPMARTGPGPVPDAVSGSMRHPAPESRTRPAPVADPRPARLPPRSRTPAAAPAPRRRRAARRGPVPASPPHTDPLREPPPRDGQHHPSRDQPPDQPGPHAASASRWSGSPNSGNQRGVSRKQCIPVIAPSWMSMTCTAHGTNPGPSGFGL